MKKKRVGLGILGGTLAVVLSLGTAVSPANAAVTAISGSRTCPVGQTVRVDVTTNVHWPVSFYAGSTLRYTSTSGSFDTYNYGTRAASWKVTSTDLAYANDYCTAATFVATTGITGAE